MELVRRVPASVAEMAGAIPARSVHGVGPPRSGECGGSGRGDSGSFCARSWSAAFRRVWRKGPGRFRLVLRMELVGRVPASVAEVAGECGGMGRGDSGSFCAWSWSAAFRRVWRKRPGGFRLVLCTELVRRVPASVAEMAGAIPARFVHGVGPPRSGECGGRGRGDFRLVLCTELVRRVPGSVAEVGGAIPARFVHGVGPPRSGECGGSGRGDSGSYCGWSWSAAFRGVWRKWAGRFRLVLCMELLRRVPASVAEEAGGIPARFVHGVGPPRSGECCGRGRGDSGSICARSWSAAFRRVLRKGPGGFHLSWPTRLIAAFRRVRWGILGFCVTEVGCTPGWGFPRSRE